MPERIVAVLGGGIAGLAAAHTLAHHAGVRVVLIEATARRGGPILTDRIENVSVEAGPDSFVARDSELLQLCRDVGATDLHSPAVFGGLVWWDNQLRPLPEDLVLGFPSSPWSFLRSGVLSRRGALRAWGDLVAGRLKGPDVSLGRFARRRFGAEFIERVIDPLFAGTRAGDLETMSLAAAAPAVDGAVRRHRSATGGLRRALRENEVAAGAPPFLAPRAGMSVLVEAIAGDLPNTQVMLNTHAGSVESTSDGRYAVGLPDRALEVDGVVVALPATAAARALKLLAPGAADELSEIRYASVAVVALVYPEKAGGLPRDGSGVLVPSSAGATIAAATLYSRKWPHSRPDGGHLIRAVVGRAGRAHALELSDEELVHKVHDDLELMLGFVPGPRSFKVWRWPDSLPQYEVGHVERVARIRNALGRHRALTATGAAYGGVGIPDCISGGINAARRVLADLRRLG